MRCMRTKSAGVQLKAGLLQTEDLDTLLNTKSEIELAGSVRSSGLLGIFRSVDKTFKPQRKRSFCAVNAKGFMVDLIRVLNLIGRRLCVDQHRRVDPICSLNHLHGLEWLTALPLITQIVIADNGFPRPVHCACSCVFSHCTSCGFALYPHDIQSSASEICARRRQLHNSRTCHDFNLRFEDRGNESASDRPHARR